MERTRRRAVAARHPPPDDLLAVMAGTARARAARDADRIILPPNPVMQDLCRRAAEVSGTPWGVLSILTAREQVTKAVYGTGPPANAGDRVPLSWSVCSYVVRDDEPLTAEDTSRDPAIRACLAIPHVGAYTGAPIRHRGVPVGALAGFAPDPQRFPAGHEQHLQRLADEATELIAAATAARA